ncbi:hypothetical protein BDR04DRAFT_1164611 [Suillus decipiens]|nr:hypothetical protein BDR04DRAFT_1164611 [Suillus decipiens]
MVAKILKVIILSAFAVYVIAAPHPDVLGGGAYAAIRADEEPSESVFLRRDAGGESS